MIEIVLFLASFMGYRKYIAMGYEVAYRCPL